MPTYEYRCKDCGNHLEVVQSFTDAALTECPSCRGSLRKVFGSIGITFKGSGFYKTDSRSSSKGSASDAKSSESKTSETKSGDSKSSESSSSGDSSASSSKETKPKTETKSA